MTHVMISIANSAEAKLLMETGLVTNAEMVAELERRFEFKKHTNQPLSGVANWLDALINVFNVTVKMWFDDKSGVYYAVAQGEGLTWAANGDTLGEVMHALFFKIGAVSMPEFAEPVENAEAGVNVE